MDEIRKHIGTIHDEGGTKMSAGMKLATQLLEGRTGADPAVYENRILFLTDAMPNLGTTDEEGLASLFKKNAARGIYTTFIGIGVDFNTDLVERITKVRGANYYSVHRASEFKKRLDEEFNYMVTPLVFNLRMQLAAKGFRIEKVYGSPEADSATGVLMKVNTLFPSKREDEETRGGVVLLKLQRLPAEERDLRLVVSYEDRVGKKDSSAESVVFPSGENEFYQDNGVRKAVLLARYAELLKNWIVDQRAALVGRGNRTPAVSKKKGIVICPPERIKKLGKWERKSVPLKVSEEYRELFMVFSVYMADEMKALGDKTLRRELDLLAGLIKK
jgi:Ca-activated chloride channel family protein